MGRRVSKREKIAFASVDSLVETKWAWKVSPAPPNPPQHPRGAGGWGGCGGEGSQGWGSCLGKEGGGWGGEEAVGLEKGGGRGHKFLKPGLTFPSPPPPPPLTLTPPPFFCWWTVGFGSTVCVSVRCVARVLVCLGLLLVVLVVVGFFFLKKEMFT